MFWRVNAGSNSSVLVRGGHFVNLTEEVQRLSPGSDQINFYHTKYNDESMTLIKHESAGTLVQLVCISAVY